MSEELILQVEERLKSFVEVGNSLLAIKEGRLYAVKGYKTFEQYVEKEWGISPYRAYRMMRLARREEAS